MKLKNFEKYIYKFIDEMKYTINDQKEYDELIANFQRDYSLENVQTLTAEKMVYGNNDKGLYHRLKQETRNIGAIDVWSTSYGVYGKDNVVKPNLKFGDTIEAASNNFKKNMIDVIKASQDEDEDSIKKNILPPTLKYKLASIYNPAYFLPVYSVKHVNHILECLGYAILNKDKKNYYFLIQILKNEKKSNYMTKEWSNHKYIRLLYYMFGSPNKSEELGAIFKDKELGVIIPTNNYKDKPVLCYECASLEDIKKEEYKFNPNKKAEKRDYIKETQRNIINGDIAEEIVIKYEKERLKKVKKNQYASKIEKISSINDSSGFDIKSFNEDGSERYIEVKSTITKNFAFNLSINELLAGEYYNDSYWIYFVSLNGDYVEIRTINNPFSIENKKKMNIQPINYKVDMKFE